MWFFAWLFGWGLVIVPHIILSFFLRLFDQTGIDVAIPIDPHGNFTVSTYRHFGKVLILATSLPPCIIYLASRSG
jgi:hypothetical protein